MRRSTAPSGVRVTLSIPSDLARQVARSPAVAAHLKQLTAEIAAEATRRCPVGDEADLPAGRRAGELRDSQEHGVIDTPRGVVGVIAYQAFYAHMVHNGTRSAHPNPWLLNAALAVMTGGEHAAAA